MDISDGEYALALRNADNVRMADQNLASAEADVARLRSLLAQAYADLAVERAHAAGLDAQVNLLCTEVPDGKGVRTHVARWASGKPATKISLAYIEAFDRTINGNGLKMDPLKARAKLQGE